VFSTHEQRTWDDIERSYAETEEPTRPDVRPSHRHVLDGRGVDDLPGTVVAGIRAGILLILCGFVGAGLAVGAATTVAGLLWRYWPLLRG